jgi:hypothetical protein
VKVIHEVCVDAVHEHSRATVMFIVPVPPAASKDDEELVTVAWQRVFVGEVTDATVVLAELPHAPTSRDAATAPAKCRDNRTRRTPRSLARFSPKRTRPLLGCDKAMRIDIRPPRAADRQPHASIAKIVRIAII